MKKTASDRILTALRKGPRRGLTAAEISNRTELPLNTVRSTLYSLATAGTVSKLGTLQTGTAGRPSNIYTL